MAIAVCCIALNACHDDTFDIYLPGNGEVGQGFTFSVNLPQLAEASLSSRGTAGDAIKEIGDNMHIYIYDENGGWVYDCGKEGFVNYSIDQNGNKAFAGFPYRIPEMNRYEADGEYPSESTSTENAYWENYKTLSAEQKTPCATFGLKDFTPVSGETYYVCVTANVDVPEANYQTLHALKDYTVTWKANDIPSNSQMFGMFSTDEKQVEGAPITYQTGVTTRLHAWLVRCASKVTVSFNTDQLNDDVWIYLHSVTIHNVARTCHLRYGNVPSTESDVLHDGESIMYAPAGSNYDNAGDEFENWPVLVRGTGSYGSDHSETAEAMFFYENLQGSGKDKNQRDVDHPTKDGEVSHPGGVTEGNYGWRDEKPYGTYIEVEAFYRSDVRGNEGKGKILYRFQLGLDSFKDYNSFRNHHYKLTLNFRGNANDVDWHIDYQPESENQIYVPHPFYISYLYGEHVEMPITISGKLTEGTKIIAEIVENNWKPNEASPAIYWNGDVWSSYQFKYDGPWHGFLSLRPTNSRTNSAGHDDIPNAEAVGRQKVAKDIDAFGRAYLMSYWYGGLENMATVPGASPSTCYTAAELEENEGMFIPQQGYREYDTTNRSGVTYDDTRNNNDSYEIVEKQVNGAEYRTHIYLPLYTRALFMVKTLGYSGANPFFGQQRKAVVKITCWIDETDANGVTRSVKRTQLCDVIQVRRIMNPAGIYREAGNNQSFTVKMAHRITERSNTFMPFASDGKWSAEIESGDAGFITLNGQQKVYGSTGEFIRFQVHFIPSKQPKNRYAVILVRYHDYTCKHRIMVRQGYEPDQLFDGGVKWHCFNLRGGQKECESPLDPGSLFRFGNPYYGIDATTNNSAQLGVDPGNKVFPLNGLDGTRVGEAVWYRTDLTDYPSLDSGTPNLCFQTFTYDQFNDSHPEVNFRKNFNLYENGQLVNAGKNTHLPRYNDWQAIRDHADMNYTFGICYDGSSTATAMTGDYAYNFSSVNIDNVGHGMRGIFAFNSKDARNIFLPVGASGFGRRKGNGNYDTPGTLRYANRAVYMPSGAVEKLPMFWNIKDNVGAIYWGFPDNVGRTDVWNSDALNGFTAWDINLTTYDFNHFAENAYSYDIKNRGNAGLEYGTRYYFSDAAFLRLVDE